MPTKQDATSKHKPTKRKNAPKKSDLVKAAKALESLRKTIELTERELASLKEEYAAQQTLLADLSRIDITNPRASIGKGR